MCNIVKKVREIEVQDEKYIMAFDMASIPVFKELSGGKSFLKSTAKLGDFDDETHLAFMGATIRPIDDKDTPIGKKIYEMDVLEMLMSFNWTVIDIVTSAMPQDHKKTEKKPEGQQAYHPKKKKKKNKI